MTLEVEDISDTYADMVAQAFRGFRQGNPAYLFFVSQDEVTQFVVDNMRSLTLTLMDSHQTQVEHRNMNDQMIMWYCLWFAMSSFTDAIRQQVVGEEAKTAAQLYEDCDEPEH